MKTLDNHTTDKTTKVIPLLSRSGTTGNTSRTKIANRGSAENMIY